MTVTTNNSVKMPVTAANALFTFYDIESLGNVFTVCDFTPRTGIVEVFYLVDQDGGALHQEILANGGSVGIEGAAAKIRSSNPAYTGDEIIFHDLSTWPSCVRLAQLIGLSDADNVNDPRASSTYTEHLRPVCDTDPDYDPINLHAYLAGYNSSNYDTVMMALFLMESFSHVGPAMERGLRPDQGFKPALASDLRRYNDDLFQEPWLSYMPRYLTNGPVSDGKGWKSVPQRIRQAMISSGRQLDVARLNEVQQKVAQKRLLGNLGGQILESNKLGVHNNIVTSIADLHELMAYNVSDVVGLAQLFEHPTYASSFDLKKGLLDEYPETIYEKKKDSYAPDVRPWQVRRNRLTPDSTSAKFAGLILAPYGPLTDMPVVSYQYPSDKVAAEKGITPVDVLEECREFFYASVTDGFARESFDRIYDYYASIRGKNFNASDEYAEAYPSPTAYGRPLHPVHDLAEIPKTANNLPYFHADGTSSTCFATFSTGGIHGAEAAWGAYGEKLRAWQEETELLAEVSRLYPDPLTLRKAKEITLPGGRVVKWAEVITTSSPISSKSGKRDLTQLSEALTALGVGVPGASPDPGAVRAVVEDFAQDRVGYKQPKPRPDLFQAKDDGSTKLRPEYAYTSAGLVIHEDFTSYYPNLLRNMGAFENPELGMDRYAKIFFDKEDYGHQMKVPGLSPVERTRLSVLRNGTKLILNAASGAGDTTFGKSPIRVNNAILSMRIMGQLFSWRIGQAQTLEGARIVSTNTDGLYSVLDWDTNQRVLDEQSALIGVDIEPEPLYVVSKDANSRSEYAVPDEGVPLWEAPIIAASGGTLACHEEPQPTKSLAHPAVLDWALVRYLRYIMGGYVPSWRKEPLSLDEPLDTRMGKRLMLKAVRDNEPVLAARLFQNIVSTSTGMITHPFAADPVDPLDPDPDTVTGERTLQHYNRVFIVHQGKPGAVSLRAAGAWKINAATRDKRSRDGISPIATDPVAMRILSMSGLARTRADALANNRTLLPEDQDVALRKVSGIDPSWSVLIENNDLKHMEPARIKGLLGCLDIDVYVHMLETVYNKNWMRKGSSIDTGETIDGEDDEETGQD